MNRKREMVGSDLGLVAIRMYYYGRDDGVESAGSYAADGKAVVADGVVVVDLAQIEMEYFY